MGLILSCVAFLAGEACVSGFWADGAGSCLSEGGAARSMQGLGGLWGSVCLWAVLLAGAADTLSMSAACQSSPQRSLLPPAPACPRIFRWCCSPSPHPALQAEAC